LESSHLQDQEENELYWTAFEKIICENVKLTEVTGDRVQQWIESLHSVTTRELLRTLKEVWQTRLKMIHVMSCYNLACWEIWE
jgi:hypothetical protein